MERIALFIGTMVSFAALILAPVENKGFAAVCFMVGISGLAICAKGEASSPVGKDISPSVTDPRATRPPTREGGE